MTHFNHREIKLEEAIEAYLCSPEGGFIKGSDKNFDARLALDTQTLLSFVKSTQSKAWERYQVIYGSDCERRFIKRFCEEVEADGLIQVLRHGIKDRGVNFMVAYFAPETSINPDLAVRYKNNILHCVRQFHYSPSDTQNTIDIVLLLNGIPIAALELKDEFSGQNVDDAIYQYKKDRDPRDPIFAFNQRLLVYFALDLAQIFMTTQLAGATTYFLPFNQGSNGAGEVGGKGNPPNPDNFMTAYLWENVLRKDRLMEILQKYIHLDVKKDGRKSIIFPRYHQLDVVTKLLADVKANGTGKNYLIQHSAGSGKSNSIAWLAHRLSGLHDANDKKIFNSVIVVTDRKVLDSQLQDTVYQFDHVRGVVKKVEKNSKELLQAINDRVPIIITTLQKFPVIFEQIKAGGRRFAIICDEAHSSQTGEAAKKLKYALADMEKELEEAAKIASQDENAKPDYQDKIVQELASHGTHKNMSFFAFTATPKGKTLQMFGTKMPDGTYRAFHIYSMRQAIEEGFILDVLKNYTTYKTYYKIAKSEENDPEFNKRKASRAVRQFESLHPHNISQKTAIMLEHVRDITSKKIGGHAKAMVVTASRLHAIRYFKEFKNFIRDNGYKNLDVLVAFSGELVDGEVSYTEEKCNKTKSGETIKENQLKEYFKSDDFNILIVAEKYQTGFDEPLLHTMFVDKRLTGVKAVQTLSRLNRTCKGKTDTFVLDFVNSPEDIKEAFQPFYQATVLQEETDPNRIYDLKKYLDKSAVYTQEQIDNVADIYFKSGEQDKNAIGKMRSILDSSVKIYSDLKREDQDKFLSALESFVSFYGFITQICRMYDKDLLKFAIFAKFLLKVIPRDKSEKVHLDDMILLEYYKNEKKYDGSIALDKADGKVAPMTGKGKKSEPKRDKLSVIVDDINKQFGTNFTEMDKVLKQIENDLINDPELQKFAKSDRETIRIVYDKLFPSILANRYATNEDFFSKMCSDKKFMSDVMARLFPIVLQRLGK